MSPQMMTDGTCWDVVGVVVVVFVGVVVVASAAALLCSMMANAATKSNRYFAWQSFTYS